MLWIGGGAYISKPYTWRPPVSTTGCNWNLTIEAASNLTYTPITAPAVQQMLNVTEAATRAYVVDASLYHLTSASKD